MMVCHCRVRVFRCLEVAELEEESVQ
jgi:hypothetical protein